jgi:ribose transport system ATP-binding protein
VEIAKALLIDSKILIMDEPTAALTENEVEILFSTVRKLKEKGVSIIYITHKLDEVFQLSNRITVLRDGEHIKTMDTKDATKDDVIKLMIGRELGDQYPKRDAQIGTTMLRIDGLANDRVKDVSLEVKKGEILGIAGLVGSGRTEMGADVKTGGTITLNGTKINIQSPVDAISKGIGLIPEDRKQQGLLLIQTIKLNMTFSSLRNEKSLLINRKKEIAVCKNLWQKLNLRAASLEQKAVNLSGGNQQKMLGPKAKYTNS